ncbi:MAG: hypothetical protein IKS41_01645 [Alphaproteobacteria bacterium]|nr:hypothetical protein [Alphaproteobacteria bacterium]
MTNENQNKSVIDHPRFSDWVRDFNPHDPKFIQEAKKRNEESEARFAKLEERAKMIEREINWGIPVEGRIRE